MTIMHAYVFVCVKGQMRNAMTESVVSEERRIDDKRRGFPAARKLVADFSTHANALTSASFFSREIQMLCHYLVFLFVAFSLTLLSFCFCARLHGALQV